MATETRALRELLLDFADGDCPVGVKHFYNAHFPGLYSIVLAKDGDCLTRAFITKPGELHADLQSSFRPFLWHAHGYDFTETTVAGRCVNICVSPCVNAVSTFHEYRIEAGIDTGKRPALTKTGWQMGVVLSRHDVCDAGDSFSMTHEIIHRVVFTPCERTGWFACVVQELRHVSPPDRVYSPHDLPDVPDAAALYQQIPPAAARDVVCCLQRSLPR